MSAEGAAMDIEVDDKDEVVVMMLDGHSDKNEEDGDNSNEEVEEDGDDDDDEQQDDDDDCQSEQSDYSYGDYDSDYEGADLEGHGPSAASRAAAAASQPGASGAKSKGKDPLADLDKILASLNEVFPEAINTADQAFLSLVSHAETTASNSAGTATQSAAAAASASAAAASTTADVNDDANAGQPDTKKPKPNSLISTKTSTLKAGVGYETGRYTGNVVDLQKGMSGAEKRQHELDQNCIPIMSLLMDFLGEYDGPEGMVQLALKMSPGFNRLLFSLLKNDALLEWGKRKDVYDKLLDLLELFSNSQFYASFLLHNLLEGDGTPDDGTSNCQTLLGVLEVKSSIMKRTQEKIVTKGSTTRSASAAPGAALGKDTIYVCDRVTATTAKVNEAIENGREAGTIVNPRLELAGKFLKADDSDSDEDNDDKPPPTEAEDIAAYLKEIKQHRLQHVALVDAINSGKTGHKFSRNFNEANGGTASSVKQKRMLRIASEIAGLSADLPVEWSSGIFVRVDEDRPDILKALIMAPEGTPYESGCFEFDIFLPLNYPDTPPKALIVTGPNENCRFNPNLYSNGKVCLSLLGTWSGPGWIPETSTLLQVLVSIQSLILVPDPYFNEPGFDASSPHQQKQSKLYDAQIRAATLKIAILGQMKKPSAMFSKVIQDHFRLKKRHILRQLDAWEKLEADAEKEAAGKPIAQKVAGGGIAHSARTVKGYCDNIRAFIEDQWPDKKKKKADGKE